MSTEKYIIQTKWKNVRCSDIIDLIHGHQFGPSDFVESDGFKVLKIGQLLSNGKIDLSSCDRIDKSRKQEFNDYVLNRGDVLMALTGATLSKTARIDQDIGIVFQNYRVGKFVPKNNEELSNDFLFYLLSSSMIKKQIFDLVNAHAQPNIGKEDFQKIKVSLPPLKEQQKIASILSKIDNLIQKTDQVIEQTQRLKKGLMQRLLTKGIGHTKFKETELGEIPEEWSIERIETLININMGQSPSSEFYNQNNVGLPFYQGVTDFGEIYPIPRIWCSDPKKIANVDEILFSVRAPVGEINLTNEKCCIGRGVASLIPKNANLKYCFYLLRYFKNKFSTYSQGSTFDAINRSQIANVKVPYTDKIKEQQKIAQILSNVDNLIQKLQDKRKSEEILKKGLMQQLLTGKIRTKV